MQTSQAFQFIAIDQIHESATNPRQTFEKSKLQELAESLRQHGLIQPITVRPHEGGFEIVAGARRFLAAQLAELFSLPARNVELTDAKPWNGHWSRTRSGSTFTRTRKHEAFRAY